MSDYLTEIVTEDERSCLDPECSGVAEPEVDGEHRYFECGDCGFRFGYERVLEGLPEGACAVGVPVEIRKRASL